MPAQDIIVIGGSAGGLEALATVVGGLPPRMNATALAVLHPSPDSCGALPQILQRTAALPVSFGIDGEAIERGHVYVAPPDHHLILVDGMISIARGPHENGFRPAVDPLFRSAAKAYSDRVVGVILSGAMDDGTFGLLAVKAAGGTAIVQHPYEAFVPSMPLSAIQNVEVDHIVRTGDIPALLVQAAEVGLKVTERQRPTNGRQKNVDPTRRDIALTTAQPDALGDPPSGFVCPECGGSLWEVEEGGLSRYRCFTGHGFTPDTLLAAQNGKLDNALWSAVRVLMERAALHRQLADRTSTRGMSSTADKYHEWAQQEEKHARIIREVLSTKPVMSDLMPAAAEGKV